MTFDEPLIPAEGITPFEQTHPELGIALERWCCQPTRETFDVMLEWVRIVRGTDRNDPCPCESGAKFKKCCGTPAALNSLGGQVYSLKYRLEKAAAGNASK